VQAGFEGCLRAGKGAGLASCGGGRGGGNFHVGICGRGLAEVAGALAGGEPPAGLPGPDLDLGVVAEAAGGVQRPHRIDRRLAADGDQVGADLGQDSLGLTRIGDQADGHGGHADLGADALGIGHLKAGLTSLGAGGA
jgi:hypothetical protein